MAKQQRPVKSKINFEEECKTYKDAFSPEKSDSFEAKKELVTDLSSLITLFRDHLPHSSIKYNNALTSIILALNTYINYEETHTGIWNGFEHLCMAHTYYSYLLYCTQPKNPKRDSSIQLELHDFLKNIRNLWFILLSQYLDYSTKH